MSFITKYKKPILIISSIAVVCVVGFFAYKFFKSNESNIDKFCAGDILIPFQEKENGKWGFIDYEGEVVIDTEFKNKPSMCVDGIFKVGKEKNGILQYQFYTVEDGKTKSHGEKWDMARNFSDGFAAVRNKDEKVKFINTDFKVAFTVEAEEVGCFNHGLAKYRNEDDKWGFIDKTGKPKIKAKYDGVNSFCPEGYATVWTTNDESDKLFSIIDEDGNEVLKLKDKYDNVGYLREGLIWVINYPSDEHEQEIGFIDLEGEKVIKMENWESSTHFVNGYASFMEDGEWGLIDKKGEKIISAKYPNLLIAGNKKVWVQDDDEKMKHGLIDLDGEKLIDFDYEETIPFYCKTTIVKDGKDWIFIDDKGDAINKHEYHSIEIDQNLILDFPNENTLISDYFESDAYADMIDIKSISELNSIKDAQDYFTGGNNDKESIFPENTYISYNRVGDYYDDTWRFYKSRTNMNFTWFKSNDNIEQNSKYIPKKARKNISSVNAYIKFDDYLKVSNVMSGDRFRRLYSNYNDEEKERFLRINSESSITEMTYTINIESSSKAYGKTYKIAQAIASKYKSQMNITNQDWEEAIKQEGSFSISGEIQNYTVTITSNYNGNITVNFQRKSDYMSMEGGYNGDYSD